MGLGIGAHGAPVCRPKSGTFQTSRTKRPLPPLPAGRLREPPAPRRPAAPYPVQPVYEAGHCRLRQDRREGTQPPCTPVPGNKQPIREQRPLRGVSVGQSHPTRNTRRPGGQLEKVVLPALRAPGSTPTWGKRAHSQRQFSSLPDQRLRKGHSCALREPLCLGG